jgi:S-adenosylmethionine hydrolase
MRERRTPPPSGVVSLLTDFGLDDAYVGIVKGVILSINPDARPVDLTHAVPPQDVRRGALLLEQAWTAFPAGTVHLAVVDPGVGTERRALAVAAGDHYFVGPDNGLLGFCFALPGARAVELTNRRYHRSPVSRTFHARDIFAPVAAHCARGVALEALGRPVTDPVRLRLPRARRAAGRTLGEVLLVDRFGNLLTNVTRRALPGPPERCTLAIGGARIWGLVRAYGDRPRHRLGALVDSSGRVEVFVRDGRAAARLGLGPGAAVSLWCSRPARSRGRSTRTTRSRKSTVPVPPPARAPASRRRTSSRPRPPSSAPPRGSRSRTSRRPSG